MPRSVRITVRYGRVVNLGNYDNVRKEVEEVVELDEGEDPVQVSIALQDKLEKQVDLWALIQRQNGQNWPELTRERHID